MINPKTLFAAGLALASLSAHAGPVEVRDFDIFVDLPTAFVFVKLPQGWKFVDKIDAKSLAELPAKVHTSLLSLDEGERIADSELGEKSAGKSRQPDARPLPSGSRSLP